MDLQTTFEMVMVRRGRLMHESSLRSRDCDGDCNVDRLAGRNAYYAEQACYAERAQQ